MESYDFLLDLAIILISTKFLGILFEKIKMPQVVGALIAGILLGPAAFNLVEAKEVLIQFSEIGVIILMFMAGMEADVKELKKAGKASLIIAVLGVIIPLIGGVVVAYIFNRPSMLNMGVDSPLYLQNLFFGVILTATSVSITVETLKEMGKINSRAGTAILGAAIIDDILGIVVLTIITSLAGSDVSISIVLLKILAFFIFAAILGGLFYLMFKYWTDHIQKSQRRFVIVCFSFCLFMAYAAEEFFGVADITGAFIAGLVISSISQTAYVAHRCETVSYAIFAPIFFASIGLKVSIPKMSSVLLLFCAIYIVVAIMTKIIGCMLGAKICKYGNREALQIGVGMVSRGEVALIVAQKGLASNLLAVSLMGPVVIMVVITTVVSPILLKLSFMKHKKRNAKNK